MHTYYIFDAQLSVCFTILAMISHLWAKFKNNSELDPNWPQNHWIQMYLMHSI